MQINTVSIGDCLDIMAGMPDNFVDTIITDPPYELTNKSGNGGFMGKKWDASGIAFDPDVWREALRVAKPGATLMAMGGTRTYHRLVCAIEDAGWEIRDCISYFSDGTQQEWAFLNSLDEEQLSAYLELHYPNNQMAWVYGQGMGLGLNVSKAIDKAEGAEREVVGRGINYDAKERYKKSDMLYQQIGSNGPQITAPSTPLAKTFDGWSSRLKPAFEPIVVAMKPLDGTYAENAERWGVSGIWLDGGRVGTEDDLKGGQYSGKIRANGSVYGKHKNLYPDNFVQPKGRFPSNLIHSNEPGVLREFAKAGKCVSSGGDGSKFKSSIFNLEKNCITKGGKGLGDSGTSSRYFAQCPPDAKPARFTYHPKASPKERKGNNHPTVKPLSLIRYLCRLTRTPIGGLVLDPFAGSGTTALACIAEGRNYILIEKEPDYVNLCRCRIAEYNGKEIAPIEIKVTEDRTEKQLTLW